MTRSFGTVFLSLAICLFLVGCKTQLYGNLREDEANLILAALLDEGIGADKIAGEENTYAVRVDEADFTRAMALLEQKGLPAKRHDSLGTVFGKEAMFSTPLEERARYLYAMQEELSRTVSEIDGVIGARVHLVLPEKDQMGQDLHTPSAAVFVRHVDDPRLDPGVHRIEIRRMIAAAVPDLAEDRIVVSFFPVPRQSALVRGDDRAAGPLARIRGLPPEALYALCGLVALLAVGLTALVMRRRDRNPEPEAEKARR